jgi:hypothetical protein
MWRKNPDPQVGPQFAQHPWHELQLVVVDPHRRTGRGDRGGLHGEPTVDGFVGLPPALVELWDEDRIVVQRPQRAVGEAFVEALLLGRRDRHRVEIDALVLEGGERRCRRLVGRTGPSDPARATGAHHGLEGRHQTARAAFPSIGRDRRRRIRVVSGLVARAVDDATDGQSVGDDDQMAASRCRGRRRRRDRQPFELQFGFAGQRDRALPTRRQRRSGSRVWARRCSGGRTHDQ